MLLPYITTTLPPKQVGNNNTAVNPGDHCQNNGRDASPFWHSSLPVRNRPVPLLTHTRLCVDTHTRSSLAMRLITITNFSLWFCSGQMHASWRDRNRVMEEKRNTRKKETTRNKRTRGKNERGGERGGIWDGIPPLSSRCLCPGLPKGPSPRLRLRPGLLPGLLLRLQPPAMGLIHDTHPGSPLQKKNRLLGEQFVANL